MKEIICTRIVWLQHKKNQTVFASHLERMLRAKDKHFFCLILLVTNSVEQNCRNFYIFFQQQQQKQKVRERSKKMNDDHIIT